MSRKKRVWPARSPSPTIACGKLWRVNMGQAYQAGVRERGQRSISHPYLLCRVGPSREHRAPSLGPRRHHLSVTGRPATPDGETCCNQSAEAAAPTLPQQAHWPDTCRRRVCARQPTGLLLQARPRPQQPDCDRRRRGQLLAVLGRRTRDRALRRPRRPSRHRLSVGRAHDAGGLLAP